MMQADAIPDWAIYLLLMPFVPIAGFVHFALGVFQTTVILGSAAGRLISVQRRLDTRARLLRTVYMPCLLLPNVAVVVWGILTDPAL